MLEGLWLKEDKRVTIINVYAPCDLQRKREQWNDLLQLRSSHQAGLWCVLGDFNSIRHREERFSSSQTRDATLGMSDFNSWISDMELEEVRSVGRRFTWCRPNGSVMSKLDGESAAEIMKFLLAVARGGEEARGARLDLHGDGVPVREAMAVHGAR